VRLDQTAKFSWAGLGISVPLLTLAREPHEDAASNSEYPDGHQSGMNPPEGWQICSTEWILRVFLEYMCLICHPLR